MKGSKWMRLMLENLPQGVALLDGKFQTLEMNSRMRRLGEKLSPGASGNGLPGDIVEKVRKCAKVTSFSRNGPYELSTPQEEKLLLSVTPVSHEGKTCFFLTLREKRLRAQVREILRKKHKVSEGELRVVMEVYEGKEDRDIAGLLGISPFTVRAHLRSVFLKLEVGSRNHLISYLNTFD